MSVQAIGWVFDHSTAEGRERLVLLSLANHAGRDDWECWPSVQTIAREVRLSVRTVQRSLRILEEQGHITVAERGEPDSRVRADRRANLYRIVQHGVTPVVTPCDGHGVTDPTPRGDRSAPEAANVPLTVLEPSEQPSAAAPAEVVGQLIEFPSSATAMTVQQSIEAVFAAWCASTGKTRSLLDSKRTRRIKWALDNYPLEECLAAVRGWENSPYHRGENDRGTTYNDLGLILRDAEHFERFRDLAYSGPSLPMSRTAHNLAAWSAQ